MKIRKQNNRGGKEIFCVLLCLVMIVGTAFSAAAESTDRAFFTESAEWEGETAEISGQNSGEAAGSRDGQQTGTALPEMENLEKNGADPEKNAENADAAGDPEQTSAAEITETVADAAALMQESDESEDSQNAGSTDVSDASDDASDDTENEEDVSEKEAPEDCDLSWYDAEASAFTLYTADQLKGLARLTAAGEDFSGKTVFLGADIDLAGGSSGESSDGSGGTGETGETGKTEATEETENTIEETTEETEGTEETGGTWNLPVGPDPEHPFRGTFDGAGHTIRGLLIKDIEDTVTGVAESTGENTEEDSAEDTAVSTAGSTAEGAGASYIGFFGYLEGTVTDLTLSGKIAAEGSLADRQIGGLAGCARGAGIRGVITEVEIIVSADSGSLRAGGLCGVSEQSVIDCSEARGAISVAGADGNRTYAGGIAGEAKGGGQICNSGCTGELTVCGDTIFVGGIAGYLCGTEEDSLRIRNGYQEGNLRIQAGAGYAGGMAGYAGAYAEICGCMISAGDAGSAGSADIAGSEIPPAGKAARALFPVSWREACTAARKTV